MYLSYRRNLDGIPETIQRAMRKQAYTDRYPHLAEHFNKTGELDDIINYRTEKGDPYEEELMYWRKANAIHKFFVDNAANGVDDCQPVQVTIDVIKDLVDRCEKILQGEVDDNGALVDPKTAMELLPSQSGFFFGSTDYDDWYIEDLKETVKALKPIVEHAELYPDPVIYEGTW
jgi:hypothetical protein